MSTSVYVPFSVTTGVTGPAIDVPVNSSVGVEIVPAAGGSCYLQYSLFATPVAETQWITWMHGTVTAAKSVDLSPSVRNIRLVSVSGAASAVLSGRCS